MGPKFLILPLHLGAVSFHLTVLVDSPIMHCMVTSPIISRFGSHSYVMTLPKVKDSPDRSELSGVPGSSQTLWLTVNTNVCWF